LGKASKTFPAASGKQPAGRGTLSACLPLSAEAANFTTSSACLIDAGLWWCCGLPILLMVKFYMFAGYSCYYKKGVGRGNSLGVHGFDGNEMQLCPAGWATLRVFLPLQMRFS